MSRYTIDGQILSDMADAVRLKKYGETLLINIENVEVASADSSSTGADMFPTYTLSYPGRKKITIHSFTYGNNSDRYSTFAMFEYSNKSGINTSGNSVNMSYYPADYPIVHYTDLDGFYFMASHCAGYLTCTIEPADDITLTPEQMVDEVEAMDTIPQDALTITGSCNYRFSNNGMNWFIDAVGDKIITKDIIGIANMFNGSSDLTHIPFTINTSPVSTSQGMFYNCLKLENIPMIAGCVLTQCNEMFYCCRALKTIPEDLGKDWDWSKLDSLTGAYSGQMNNMFYECNKLRNVPEGIISHTNPVINGSYSLYARGFYNCYCLEKINNLCVPYNASWSSNVFASTFNCCERLKDLTFKVQEDGTPYACPKWKNQVIDLTTVGFGTLAKNYDTSLTDDTKADGNRRNWINYITDTTSFPNPDGWAQTAEWSVYERQAAVRTINTLPDVSASGATNTIKFKSTAASATDEDHAMSNLSEAEIAVAAAKGWTVSLV
jgi:hypothetical protein